MIEPSVTISGTVEKIVKPLHPSLTEKAQISAEGAGHLYREIRSENSLTDENGRQVKLKEGAEVEVTVEADPDTLPKHVNDSQGHLQENPDCYMGLNGLHNQNSSSKF